MSDNTKPVKLEQQIREACRVRHYSLSTERVYVAWYKRFVRWAGMRHPATLGGDMVERWLSSLATEGDVSASTQRQALAAVLFLYRQVLSVDLPWMDNVVRAKQSHRPQAGKGGDVNDLIERLRDNSGSHINGLYDREAADEIERLRDEIEVVCARLSRVSQDAARYDYLRKGNNWPAVFFTTSAPEPLTGNWLDEAIDAAMAAKEATK